MFKPDLDKGTISESSLFSLIRFLLTDNLSNSKMSQGWQLLDLYCKGVCTNSPLSRGWIIMPHAKSVQPGADKITPARQWSRIYGGGCLWLRGMSLTLHLRLGGNYVSKAGLRLTPILLSQLPKCMEYTSEPCNDFRGDWPRLCRLYPMRSLYTENPFSLHSGFQTQSLSWFAFVFSTQVFKLPSCAI